MGEGGADWRTRLYDSYVSSGQSASLRADSLSLRNYPQFVRTIERAMNGVDTSARVADLGCGFGSLVFCLREMGWTNVEGVDISPEQIELAHRLGVSEVRLGDVAAFLEEREGTLDVVFLMDVLEHLTRQELFDALDGVMRALAPGGRIVTHVPNGAGIFPGRVRWGDLTHEQAFTSNSCRQMLRCVGFESIRVFEEGPTPRGVRGMMRRAAWEVLALQFRLLLYFESGLRGQALSQNILVVAHKPRV